MAVRRTYYSGPNLTAEQVASYLYGAGFRGDALVNFTAIVMRESGLRNPGTPLASTGAHGTAAPRDRLSGDLGLGQVNWDTFGDDLIGAGIINGPADLFNPATNARALKWIFDQYQYRPWSSGAGGYVAGGDPFHGTNRAAARIAVDNAAKQGFATSGVGGVGVMDSSGTQGQAKWSTDFWGNPVGVAGDSGVAAPGSLPSDARLVRNDNGLFAMFKLANGVWIHYGVGANTKTDGLHVTRLSNSEFNRAFGSSVNGGNASELHSISSSYGSYKAFWDSIVTQVLGQSNPAVQDPGVLRVLAQFAARPDMSEAELQNRLRDTDYWRSRTEGELQWNSLAPAEQQTRRADTASRMQQAYFQFMGRQVGAADPSIKEHLEAVASGKMTMSQWTEQVIKPKALAFGESPWSRQVRSEQEDQRRRGVDIENTAASVRQQLKQWGLKWSEPSLTWWATALVEKRKSDDDLLQNLQAQATQLYGKFKTDPSIDTTTAAAPWIETYNRVMENTGSVFTPEVARALQNGQTVWDFEQALKKTPKWRETRNGREELTTLAQELGNLTGFA